MVCYVLTTRATFFAAATKSTNEINKAGSICQKSVYLS